MLSKYGLPTYYEVCFSILLTDASLESASAPGAYNGQMLNKMFIDLKPTFIREAWTFWVWVCLEDTF